MNKLILISAKEALKKVKKLGYIEVRQVGSHIRLKHFEDKNRKAITIPMHNKDLGRGLLRKILRDLDVSIEEFNEL